MSNDTRVTTMQVGPRAIQSRNVERRVANEPGGTLKGAHDAGLRFAHHPAEFTPVFSRQVHNVGDLGSRSVAECPDGRRRRRSLVPPCVRACRISYPVCLRDERHHGACGLPASTTMEAVEIPAVAWPNGSQTGRASRGRIGRFSQQRSVFATPGPRSGRCDSWAISFSANELRYFRRFGTDLALCDGQHPRNRGGLFTPFPPRRTA